MAVDGGQDLDVVAVLLQPRRADEHGADRAVDPRDLEVLLEGADLAAERVALAQRVHAAQVRAVEHDHAGAGAEHRATGPDELPQRIREPFALDPERHRGRLAARHHQPVEALQVSGDAHLARLGAEAAQCLGMRFEVALEGEDADHQPRLASSWPSSSLRVSSELMAVPSPSDAAATRAGSL